MGINLIDLLLKINELQTMKLPGMIEQRKQYELKYLLF